MFCSGKVEVKSPPFQNQTRSSQSSATPWISVALHQQIPTFHPFCSPRRIRRHGLHSRRGLRRGNLRDLGSRRLCHRRNRLCLRDLQTDHVGASGEAERLLSNTTSVFLFPNCPVEELTASKARVSRFGRTALVALLPSCKVHVTTRAAEQIKIGTMQKKSSMVISGQSFLV